MKSENLQLACVQSPTSSYNLILPHGRHGRHGHSGHGSHGGHCDHGGHMAMFVRTGQDRIGQNRIFVMMFNVLLSVL